MNSRNNTVIATRLLLGVLMLGLGVTLLLTRMHILALGPIWRFWPRTMIQFGLMELHLFWRLWPLALIVLGFSGLFKQHELHFGTSGFLLMFIGLWYLLINFGIFGMTFRNSWPILLAGFGLSQVLGSLSELRTAPRGREVRHDG